MATEKILQKSLVGTVIHCLLGDTIADELYEYKNLGVLKNYVGSFSSNVEDYIDKTRKKVGLIFSSNFDHRKVNPLVYMKLWKQACLPSLLFGVELWMLTPTLLLKLERCQYCCLKHIFYVSEFAPGPLSHWRNLIFFITLKHGITTPFSLHTLTGKIL